MGAMAIRMIGALLVLGVLLPGMALDMAAAPAVLAQDDPATVVRRFFDARNRHDIDATLGLVTDDFRFVGGPTCTQASPCVGREALRTQHLQSFIATRAQATIVGAPQVSGATAVVRYEVRDDFIRRAGVERIALTATIGVRGAQLASHVAVPDASDAQTAQYLAFVQSQQGAGTPPGMPNTGGGGNQQEADRWRTLAWALVGLGLVAGLCFVGRRRAAPR